MFGEYGPRPHDYEKKIMLNLAEHGISMLDKSHLINLLEELLIYRNFIVSAYQIKIFNLISHILLSLSTNSVEYGLKLYMHGPRSWLRVRFAIRELWFDSLSRDYRVGLVSTDSQLFFLPSFSGNLFKCFSYQVVKFHGAEYGQREIHAYYYSLKIKIGTPTSAEMNH